MRAIYFDEFSGPLTIKDIPTPKAGPKSVVIKVEATGLCRSDWHAYVGHDSDIKLPHVPGHELAGLISEVGSEVKNFKMGDRVTVPFVNGCGTCEFCLRGNAQVCPSQTQPGFTQFGSFAEFVSIENADFNLIKLPDEIEFATAAALGCRFATAYRGLVARAQVTPGQNVAIFGCGGVGLSALLIAKALGAKTICVDISDSALKMAAELGADSVINAKSEDVVKKIGEITNGGADVAVDALGSEITANQSVLSLKRLGKHIQLGLLLTPDGKTPMSMARIIAFELDILGSHGMAAVDYPKMLELVTAKKLNPNKLVSGVIDMDQGLEMLAKLGQEPPTGIWIIAP
ncbi:MAG: hypothetical protein RL129_944 [Actinomycetota bacterium]|jgi:alcohol dehydrogenase